MLIPGKIYKNLVGLYILSDIDVHNIITFDTNAKVIYSSDPRYTPTFMVLKIFSPEVQHFALPLCHMKDISYCHFTYLVPGDFITALLRVLIQGISDTPMD